LYISCAYGDLYLIVWPLLNYQKSRDCNLNCVSKEKNIIFTNTVFL
jgi:hypothetical protein